MALGVALCLCVDANNFIVVIDARLSLQRCNYLSGLPFTIISGLPLGEVICLILHAWMHVLIRSTFNFFNSWCNWLMFRFHPLRPAFEFICYYQLTPVSLNACQNDIGFYCILRMYCKRLLTFKLLAHVIRILIDLIWQHLFHRWTWACYLNPYSPHSLTASDTGFIRFTCSPEFWL